MAAYFKPRHSVRTYGSPEPKIVVTTMRNKETPYAIGLAFLFLAVGAYTTNHHEMWRDEIQAWLLARDSASVFELFAHLKYEGHPGDLAPLSYATHSYHALSCHHAGVPSPDCNCHRLSVCPLRPLQSLPKISFLLRLFCAL